MVSYANKNQKSGLIQERAYGFPFRNVELERRINERVKLMLDRGLIRELEQFHEEYNRACAEADESFDYTRGVFQAIGFKEFHDYLLLSENERKSEHGAKLFANGRYVELNLKCKINHRDLFVFRHRTLEGVDEAVLEISRKMAPNALTSA